MDTVPCQWRFETAIWCYQRWWNDCGGYKGSINVWKHPAEYRQLALKPQVPSTGCLQDFSHPAIRIKYNKFQRWERMTFNGPGSIVSMTFFPWSAWSFTRTKCSAVVWRRIYVSVFVFVLLLDGLNRAGLCWGTWSDLIWSNPQPLSPDEVLFIRHFVTLKTERVVFERIPKRVIGYVKGAALKNDDGVTGLQSEPYQEEASSDVCEYE